MLMPQLHPLGCLMAASKVGKVAIKATTRVATKVLTKETKKDTKVVTKRNTKAKEKDIRVTSQGMIMALKAMVARHQGVLVRHYWQM